MIDIENPNPRELEQSFYKLCHSTNAYERKFREAEKKYKALKNFKDEIFNKLVLSTEKIGENGKPRTNADREREARATNDWTEFNQGLHDAEELMLDVQVEFKIRLRDWETCRSLLSSLNTQRRTNT